jgi:NDP-sugar pyrophosphorylase family protein
VHRDAVVASDVVFVGPVLVGSGARIMSGAVIVGPTSIGCEASVGPGVLISRSAIWRRSVLHERAVADRCLVSDDTVVDPHTHAFGSVMVANVRRERHRTRGAIWEVPERPSLEMLGKLIRYRLGAWSRSAAPE